MFGKADNFTHTQKQYASEVLDFSSQYGSDNSISYTAHNIVGVPTKFPEYGDFSQTFAMRDYGPWWAESPSGRVWRRPYPGPRLQGTANAAAAAQNFIDIKFEHRVYPFRQCFWIRIRLSPGSGSRRSKKIKYRNKETSLKNV
jgi:hypothetical protein